MRNGRPGLALAADRAVTEQDVPAQRVVDVVDVEVPAAERSVRPTVPITRSDSAKRGRRTLVPMRAGNTDARPCRRPRTWPPDRRPRRCRRSSRGRVGLGDRDGLPVGVQAVPVDRRLQVGRRRSGLSLPMYWSPRSGTNVCPRRSPGGARGPGRPGPALDHGDPQPAVVRARLPVRRVRQRVRGARHRLLAQALSSQSIVELAGCWRPGGKGRPSGPSRGSRPRPRAHHPS